MQTNTATVLQERRGHDRVLDAIHLKVAEEGSMQTAVVNSAPDIPTHKVSLSLSGLAFADKGFYTAGSELDATLFFYPSKDKIDCKIKIVSVGDAPEVSKGDWLTYRATFSELPDSQASLLSEHVDSLLSKVSVLSE